MKKIMLLPALMLALTAGLRADDGCDKSADACKPRIKKVTPFMAELKKAQSAPALTQGAIKELSVKQAGPKAQLVEPPPPAAAPAQKAPAEEDRTVSHPAWLLAAAALLAGLYFFLRESKKKGKGR